MPRSIAILIGVQLVDAIGLGLLLPVLPYFVQEYGAAAVEVTQLVALYALAGLLFGPLVGRISDAIGRKLVVLACTIGTAIAYAMFLFVESLVWIFIVRFFTGAMAAKGGVVSAWLIDLVDESDRARYLGLLGSMNGVGMLIGPLLASLVLAGSGEVYAFVFISGALLSIAASVGVLLIGGGSVELGRVQPNTLPENPKHYDLLALNFTIFLLFSVVFSVSAVYMQARFHWSVSEAGMGIGVMTGTVALARAFVAHRLFQVLGTELATWISGVVMALGLLVASLFASPVWFLIFYCLSAAAYSVAAIGVTLMLAARLEPEVRGAGMGRLGAAASAAIVFGAASHGYLFVAIAPEAPFQLYGMLVAVLINAWFVIYRQRSRAIEQA